MPMLTVKQHAQVGKIKPGARVAGGTLLIQSSVFKGDGITRPYVVRLVIRDHTYDPFVVWVYFLDGTDRGHGDYCGSLKAAWEAYQRKCQIWSVSP